MITHNVTAEELRSKGIWCVTSEEYESGKSVIVKDNRLQLQVYEGVLMELELRHKFGRNKGNNKRYLQAVNKIKREMNSVTAERITYE